MFPRGWLRLLAHRVDRRFGGGSPDVVFDALRRAVVASGFELQGADATARTVYFKRGRTNLSGAVAAQPDGSSIVSLFGASPSLYDRVASELEGLLAASRAAEAATQQPAQSTELAADLHRLGIFTNAAC